MASDVEHLYASTAGDFGFARVMSAAPVDATRSLADLIEADGRLRLRLGRSVDLDRYLTAVPELQSDLDALDAALDIALRGLSRSSRIAPDAVTVLSERHPLLAASIREAASLNAALWSTSGVQGRVTPAEVKPLPCDFGPRLPSGQRRYVLEHLLGQGSFGQVYRATDRQLSEDADAGHRAIVAIKVLAEAERTPVDRQRLIDEATKVRRISHPNVVQVLDRGVSEDDEDFIVYEHVDGGDLSDLREQQLPLPPRDAATLMASVARGVHAAHSAGVIHCDLKPSNIMRTAAGQPKVADFGIAIRLEDRASFAATTGSAGRGPIGNIAFISPEQFRGEDAALSVPSDVYALGGILFFLLTGRLPNGSTRSEIARTHAAKDGRSIAPSPRDLVPAVDRDLEAICRRALSPRPEDRYDSSAALATDLERWLALEPIAWTRPPVGRRLILWSQRKPGLAVSAAVIAALTIAGVAVGWHFASVARERRIQVALAESELGRNQADAVFRAGILSIVKASLSKIKQDERFLTDMLFSVWLFEYIYGPKALNSPPDLQDMWNEREKAMRGSLERRRGDGQPDTIETLLREQLLAFWMVSRGEYRESTMLLDHNLAAWKNLAPNDPIVRDVQMMRRCAEINRLHAAAADEIATPPATLVELAAQQAADVERLELERPRSAEHYLALGALARVYDLQGRASDADQLRQRVKQLLNSSQYQGGVPQTRPAN